jgi:ketosteroid isomerase-like protein
VRAGWLSGLLTTPLVLCACATQAVSDRRPAAPHSSEQALAQVRQAERAWLDAYERHDAATMAGLLAREFVITYPGGRRLTRQEALRQVEASAGRPPTRFRSENVNAYSAGATIVLTGTLVGEGARGQIRQLYTDTWVWDSGSWRVLSSHLSQAPPAAAQAE